MPLTVKPAGAVVGGEPDYFVKSGELTMGRIMIQRQAGGVHQWQWSLQSVHTFGVPSYGLTDMKEAALERLTDAWRAWLAYAGARLADEVPENLPIYEMPEEKE
jgi:hypothetical protein